MDLTAKFILIVIGGCIEEPNIMSHVPRTPKTNRQDEGDSPARLKYKQNILL